MDKLLLQKDQTLDEKEIAQIKRQEAVESAFTRALHILSYRAHSIQELRTKLSKNIEGDVIDEVVSRLERAGLVDDEKFASEYVELRRKGDKVLRYELYRKGISEEAVDKALDERDPDHEDNLFLDFYKKAIARYAGEAEPKKRIKIYRYLLAKGFSYERINKEIKK